VQLQDWTSHDDDEREAATRLNLANGGGFLIDQFGNPATSAVILDWLPPSVRKLLLVDGLNELPSARGLQILKAVDELTRNQVSMAAIVTDRLARRDLPVPVRWALGLVLPLSNEQIQSVKSKALDHEISDQLLTIFSGRRTKARRNRERCRQDSRGLLRYACEPDETRAQIGCCRIVRCLPNI